MSDQAWVGLVATAYSLEVIEQLHAELADLTTDFETYWQEVSTGDEYVHPRYLRGTDYTRSEANTEEACDAWKAANWKQAVLHAELKARKGLETHWMLYFLQGMYIHDRDRHSYEGYIPVFVPCECCWQETLLLDPDEPKFFDQCDNCKAQGHEPGPGMDHRWHTYLGIWWVEKLEDNGEGYFPTSFVVWYDKDYEGESAAIAAAKQARAQYDTCDLVYLVNPKAQKTLINP